MELEKFHVHDFRACPESERYSVTCSYFGVSGEFEELPRTSGGQYQVSAFKALDPAGQCIEAVILRDLQDLDYKEIAQVLGIPEGTVKSRISRGRAELARLLERNKREVM